MLRCIMFTENTIKKGEEINRMQDYRNVVNGNANR